MSSFKSPSPLTPLLASVLVAAGLLPSQAAWANQSLGSPGYSLTVGPGFNRSNLYSALFNPANAEKLIDADDHFRMSLLQFGGQYEMGSIDNLQQQADALKAKVDAAKASNSAADAQIAVDEINQNFLPLLDRGARFSVLMQTSLLSPVLIRSKETLPGVWSLNMDLQAQGGARLRTSDANVLVKFASSDPGVNGNQIQVPTASLVNQLTTLQSATTPAAQQSALNSLMSVLSPADQATATAVVSSLNTPGTTMSTSYAVTTSTAIDIRSALVRRTSLGYATPLSRVPGVGVLSPFLPVGQIDLGVRFNGYQAELRRQVAALVDTNGSSLSISNMDSEAYKRQTGAFGIDVGANWHSENFQLGATLYNLNNPSLRYPSVQDDPNVANRQAATALAALGKVEMEAAVNLKPHVVVEGAVRSENQRWLLQGSTALNETTDFVGEPRKYVTLSASYNGDRYDTLLGRVLGYIAPSIRLGYRHNLVGSGLTSYGLGISWGALNLDFISSSETNATSSGSVPRSVGAGISIAQKF
jgi:hypothetical protein